MKSRVLRAMPVVRAMLVVWLVGTGTRTAHATSRPPSVPHVALHRLEPALLRTIKMAQEYQVERRLGVATFCHLDLANCIAAYDRLAHFESGGDHAAVAGGLKLIQIDSSSRDYDEVSLSVLIGRAERAGGIARLLGTVPTGASSDDQSWFHERPKLSTPLSQRLALAILDDFREGSESAEFRGCPRNSAYFDRLFADDLIRVGIYLGYFDLKKLGDDSPGLGKYEHHLTALGQNVQRNLEERLRWQGFTLYHSTDDGSRNLYYTEFLHRGQNKSMIVEVVNSNTACEGDVAVTPGINYRGKMGLGICTEQRAKSDMAIGYYEDSLTKHHMTMYIGHARGVLHEDGLLSIKARGPSFVPFWAKHSEVAIQDGALLQVAKWPFAEKLLYLNSCSSFQHYLSDINDVRAHIESSSPDTGLTFVGNRYKNSIRFYPYATAALITGILEHKCGPVIRKAMDHNINIYSERLTASQRNYSLIDGALGNYDSYRDGHPRVRVDGDPGYTTYGGRVPPADPFSSLVEISEIWHGGYLQSQSPGGGEEPY